MFGPIFCPDSCCTTVSGPFDVYGQMSFWEEWTPERWPRVYDGYRIVSWAHPTNILVKSASRCDGDVDNSGADGWWADLGRSPVQDVAVIEATIAAKAGGEDIIWVFRDSNRDNAAVENSIIPVSPADWTYNASEVGFADDRIYTKVGYPSGGRPPGYLGLRVTIPINPGVSPALSAGSYVFRLVLKYDEDNPAPSTNTVDVTFTGFRRSSSTDFTGQATIWPADRSFVSSPSVSSTSTAITADWLRRPDGSILLEWSLNSVVSISGTPSVLVRFQTNGPTGAQPIDSGVYVYGASLFRAGSVGGAANTPGLDILRVNANSKEVVGRRLVPHNRDLLDVAYTYSLTPEDPGPAPGDPWYLDPPDQKVWLPDSSFQLDINVNGFTSGIYPVNHIGGDSSFQGGEAVACYYPYTAIIPIGLSIITIDEAGDETIVYGRNPVGENVDMGEKFLYWTSDNVPGYGPYTKEVPYFVYRNGVYPRPTRVIRPVGNAPNLFAVMRKQTPGDVWFQPGWDEFYENHNYPPGTPDTYETWDIGIVDTPDTREVEYTIVHGPMGEPWMAPYDILEITPERGLTTVDDPPFPAPWEHVEGYTRRANFLTGNVLGTGSIQTLAYPTNVLATFTATCDTIRLRGVVSAGGRLGIGYYQDIEPLFVDLLLASSKDDKVIFVSYVEEKSYPEPEVYYNSDSYAEYWSGFGGPGSVLLYTQTVYGRDYYRLVENITARTVTTRLHINGSVVESWSYTLNSTYDENNVLIETTATGTPLQPVSAVSAHKVGTDAYFAWVERLYSVDPVWLPGTQTWSAGVRADPAQKIHVYKNDTEIWSMSCKQGSSGECTAIQWSDKHIYLTGFEICDDRIWQGSNGNTVHSNKATDCVISLDGTHSWPISRFGDWPHYELVNNFAEQDFAYEKLWPKPYQFDVVKGGADKTLNPAKTHWPNSECPSPGALPEDYFAPPLLDQDWVETSNPNVVLVHFLGY